VIRTDGSKRRLSDLVSIKSRLTAYKHPIEGITNVLSIPITAIPTPPRIVDLSVETTRLVARVCQTGPV
jgi:hypothetical protein